MPAALLLALFGVVLLIRLYLWLGAILQTALLSPVCGSSAMHSTAAHLNFRGNPHGTIKRGVDCYENQ
jgi:hypothetical protein